MDTAHALSENLAALLRREHEALADFLVALADFDQRRLWVELGHSSFFYFLHRELRLSLGAAQHRKVAAELIQQVPGVIEPLRRGQLCLSSIIEVAKVVTPENWETVLPRFYGLSRREAMEVVAELQPHPAPPVRTVVTAVRSDPRPQGDVTVARALSFEDVRESQRVTSAEMTVGVTSLESISPGEMGLPLTPCTAPVVSHRAQPTTFARPLEIVRLSADQSRLHVTVSKGFMKKLEAATDAMSHAMPGATPEEILEAGLELLLEKAAKRKGLVTKPQKKARPMKGDGIPAHVKREAWKRDGGRCQYPLASGGICGSTRHLEFDHVRPRSLGGPSTVENIRVVCRPHNDLAARLVLGDERMDPFTRGLRATKTPAGLKSSPDEVSRAPSLG